MKITNNISKLFFKFIISFFTCSNRIITANSQLIKAMKSTKVIIFLSCFLKLKHSNIKKLLIFLSWNSTLNFITTISFILVLDLISLNLFKLTKNLLLMHNMKCRNLQFQTFTLMSVLWIFMSSESFWKEKYQNFLQWLWTKFLQI